MARDEILTVRLSEAERQILRGAASLKHQTEGELIRNATLEKAGEILLGTKGEAAE